MVNTQNPRGWWWKRSLVDRCLSPQRYWWESELLDDPVEFLKSVCDMNTNVDIISFSYI